MDWISLYVDDVLNIVLMVAAVIGLVALNDVRKWLGAKVALAESRAHAYIAGVEQLIVKGMPVGSMPNEILTNLANHLYELADDPKDPLHQKLTLIYGNGDDFDKAWRDLNSMLLRALDDKLGNVIVKPDKRE